MDLDSIIIELGEFKRYQVYIFLLLSTSVVFNSFYSISYVFVAGDLNYRCFVNGCDGSEKYDQEWVRNAIPLENGRLSKCSKYGFNNETFESCLSFDRTQIEKCDKFIFETNEKTIVNDFELYCDENKWKLTLVGTVNNIGQFIGLPLAGIFSDRYGRKIALTGMLLASTIVGLLRSFSQSYNIYLLLELLDATVASGCYSASFLLGMEIIGPNKRVFGSVILCCCYSIGEVALGLAAWVTPDWRVYLRTLYLPGFLFIFYIWTIPESLRWLYTHKKYDELKLTLQKIASVNQTRISNENQRSLDLLGIEVTKEETIQEHFSWAQVLRSKIIKNRLMICAYVWITHTFVFYGLSLNSVSIVGNKYSNFILVSLVEVPGYFMTLYAMDRYGRRTSNSSFLYLSGLACLGFYLLPKDMTNVRLMLFLIGKCMITGSFNVLYVFTSEMYPTRLRHSLIGMCSMFGRVGSMLAPQTPLLSNYVDPVLVFGTMSFLAGICCIYFPETKNVKLPDTLEEAENIGLAKIIEGNAEVKKEQTKV